MKFVKNQIYRHDRAMDIDMVVRQVLATTPAGTKLDVLWVSKQTRRYISGDEVFIKSEQYPNWKKVDL